MAEIREGFGSGERHGWMSSWCDTLAMVIAGQDAQALLDSGLPRAAGVVVLPSFTWQHSGIDMGRKDRARGGGRLLMPVRVVWSHGTVVLVEPGQSVEVSWEASGLGVNLEGSVTLTAAEPGWEVLSFLSANVPPEGTKVKILPADDLRTKLAAISSDGGDAWWHAITSLQTYVEMAVRNAHKYITRDTVPDKDKCPDTLTLLDEQALVSCADRLMLGDPERPDEPSSVVRLLKRSLEPGAFSRVDPEMFTQRAIRRDAQLEVRRYVGDPPTGSKIRRTARDLGITSPENGGAEQVLWEYQRRHPGDRMGLDRIRRAMQVRPVEIGSLIEDVESDRGVSPWPSTRLA